MNILKWICFNIKVGEEVQQREQPTKQTWVLPVAVTVGGFFLLPIAMFFIRSLKRGKLRWYFLYSCHFENEIHGFKQYN